MKNKKGEIKKKKVSQSVGFPASVVAPVASFLKARLESLQARKKEIEKEDPFKDEERLTDNASPDADAAEQFGHARVLAVRQQLTRSIIQTRKALSRLKIGKYGLCEDCGQMIDTDRLVIYPEATLCAKDAAKREM